MITVLTFFLFLMNMMISTTAVTVIPTARTAPTVLPAIHPPPQPKLPSNIHMQN